MKAKWRCVALAVLLGLANVEMSLGTSTGMSTDPAGAGWNRGDAQTAFAVWDSYPNFTFSGDTSDSSGGFASAALTQIVTLTGTVGGDQGAGVYSDIATQAPGSDIFYGGGRGGDFTLAANTAFNVGEAFLQIKRSASQTNFVGAIIPTLNGIPFDSVTSTSGTDDTHSGGAYSVTTWRWHTALIGQSINNPTVAFTSPMHRGLDGITLDVAIPEPTSVGMLGLVTLGASLLRRNRRAQVV